MQQATVEQVLEANTKTQEHINLVRKFLRIAATEILKRGEVHDLSKFSEAEVNMYALYTSRLRGMTYDSPEYRQCLAEMKASGGLGHHYENNRHHPEHYPNGINDMNLIDVLEMYIDWLASTRRHADGDIQKSIEANQGRFQMSDQLAAIFRNTAKDVSFDEP
jgi:hypothetical protein